MDRWKVSLALIAIVIVALFILVPNVLLTVFAGVLVAVFLHGGGDWIARRLGIASGWGIGIFLLLVLLTFAAIGMFAASAIAQQFSELVSQIPAAVDAIRERLQDYAWAEAVLQRVNPLGLFSSSDAASTAVTSTFGALGNFVIIVFIGLYVALDPNCYRRGILTLLAPSVRERGDEVLIKGANTLKRWLAAQLLAMTVVGTLTGFGLWLIGIPLAFILGLIAALLAFIPNIGPIIAAVPAFLLAFPEGFDTVLWVLAVYLSVQTLESYFITPLMQQESVSLPPAFIIAMQLLLGVMFGLMGLALATPLAALGMTLTNELYIKDFLQRSRPAAIEPTRR